MKSGMKRVLLIADVCGLLTRSKNADEWYHWYDRVDSRFRLEQIAKGEFVVSPLVGPLVITDHR